MTSSVKDHAGGQAFIHLLELEASLEVGSPLGSLPLCNGIGECSLLTSWGCMPTVTHSVVTRGSATKSKPRRDQGI